MKDLYSTASRDLQDRFDTRRLADRLAEVKVHDKFTAADRAFIEARDMFFLATVNAAGQPTCSYKGGDPGFVSVIDDRTLAFPNYDGNGMYLSMGNVRETRGVGLLFIDFEGQRRLRVDGTAELVTDHPLLARYEGAQFMVLVGAARVYPNCPRYIHRYELAERSTYVPRAGGPPPIPPWKQSDWASDVLPACDPARGPRPEDTIVMSKYRNALPQLSGNFFMTDGGIETTLIFLEGQDLPYFAAFDLLKTPEGEAVLRKYFATYADLATRYTTGLILETATWRANPDWGEKLGYDRDALAEANSKAVRLVEDIRSEYETNETPIVISGCVGPRGDGYIADSAMSAQDADDYHRVQIDTFATTAADLVTAITMNYVEEAIGLTRAARRARMPVVISFTVETDGRLPTGQSLGDAIRQVDDDTSRYPAYYMINCAHPSHFDQVVSGDAPWLERIRGLRANASRMSHEELNDAPDLDAGIPAELGREYAALRSGQLKRLNVMGGCCGTDHRHVEQIALACMPLFREVS